MIEITPAAMQNHSNLRRLGFLLESPDENIYVYV